MWTEDEYNEWLKEAYPMNGEEIAGALNYSRQNVSQLLKRSLTKCYLHLVRTQKDMTPFEIAALMAKMFNVGVKPEEENESEVRKFFKLFPANIRRKIRKDAKEKFGVV
jgi:DNA-binding transcriptional regulator LsrR (DeoR family)